MLLFLVVQTVAVHRYLYKKHFVQGISSLTLLETSEKSTTYIKCLAERTAPGGVLLGSKGSAICILRPGDIAALCNKSVRYLEKW